MSDDRLGLGIIGFGRWPRAAYAPILREMADIEVIGVAARTDATLAVARELISLDVQLFHNYHDLLANPRVGAVIIATPNNLHAEVASWALKAGKHVLLEAPFGESAEQVFPLLDQAEQAGRVFQGDLELGYLPVMYRLRDLIAGGALGELLSVSVTLWCNWGFGGGNWPEESTRQGFFVWTGAWYVHVLDTLIGRLPERVSAIGVRAMNGPLMDHGWASLDYGRNLIGRFEFNIVAIEGQDIQVRIAGTRGEASADLTSGEYRWRSIEAKAWQLKVAPPAQPAPGFVGMRECLAGFVRAIRHGEPVLANANACRRVHQIIFALQQAADEGRIVTFS
jgi:predicted dehydrogenase